MDGATIKQTLLDVVKEYHGRGPGFFQSEPIIREASRRLGFRRPEDDQLVLTLFGDLFLQGLLAWGYDSANPNPPFLHLTDRGRAALANLSRDPSNPDGYLAAMRKAAKINAVATSYCEEALRTFNAACWRSTAVMIGAASESLVLDVRDALEARLSKLGRPVPKDLQDWRIKKILDAIQKELGAHKKDMGNDLATGFEAYWPAFIQAIRAVRNEAGHPISVGGIGYDTVHGSLLIFPEVAKLAQSLREWIKKKMK